MMVHDAQIPFVIVASSFGNGGSGKVSLLPILRSSNMIEEA